MEKYELQNLIGYEITQEGFCELQKMYMSCDLDKYQFAELIKHGARMFKVQKTHYIFNNYILEWENGEEWAIYKREIGNAHGVFLGYVKTLNEAKAKAQRELKYLMK